MSDEVAASRATVRIEADAVLFDSDGVLVDSHRQVDVAWNTLATEFGLDWGVISTQHVGVPARQTLARHLTDAPLAAAVLRLEELEVSTAEGTDPIGGAAELIASLPAGRWAVVTSATRRLGEARWAGARLPMPAHAITADDVERGKPFPDPFLAGAALLGVAPERCVVFEDSPSGGVAAAAAGAVVVQVGHQTWSVVPAARVRDLADVHVSVGHDGRLALDISSDLLDPRDSAA